MSQMASSKKHPRDRRGPANVSSNSVYEVTNQKLTERRTSMLNALAAVPAPAVDAVYAHILATLTSNAADIPLAMLYTLDAGIAPSVLRLQGYFGLPKTHPLVVDHADVESDHGLMPDLRRAGAQVVVIDYDTRFDAAAWTGWGAPSKHIAIVPITSGARVFGHLVIGTNPYRPHDDTCMQFIHDMRRMTSSIVAAAVESETYQLRQDRLEADLAFSNLKLRHLIDHASVGMCHISVDGSMLFANDHYYRLCGATAEEHAAPYSFLDVYLDEDQPKAQKAWQDLLAGVDHVTVEMRLKRIYTSPNGEKEPAQIQVLAFPYRDSETGQVTSIMACTTDIARLKWAQTFQARLATEAREAKRQQEAFIDVVSHEMRNPLSAIMHCSDAITAAVEECQRELRKVPVPCPEALNDSAQSAKVIMQCAIHQKRIIDDVLTLSKLDSMLLAITPVAVEPAVLINSIVGIFEPEMKNNRILYDITPDISISGLNIDHVYLDPSRVTQIFINLLTNGIKFVKPSKHPTISVRFGACRADPRRLFPKEMFWATEGKQDDDLTNDPEWGSGEELFLAFSVKDSGIGLQPTEIMGIFERFKQANVKTHVTYGGSGLGLFISKQLTEKQGGEIGVASIAGQGSTFGFYVKCRRVESRPQVLSQRPKQDGARESPPQQLRVLLVEDNLINQQVLGKQLKKAGCFVDVANHGLEALHILEDKMFDIALMDWEMPVLDGLAATRAIRQKELAGEGLLGQAMTGGTRAGARLPIIAVTANVRKEQMDTAIAAGADRVMQKPFKAADLLFMMNSLLPQNSSPAIALPTPGLAIRSSALIP
jgi:signal transduction histidine kinase